MAKIKRQDGRRADQLRKVAITPGFVSKADGSCLIEVGGTRVICTASCTPGVPDWLKGKARGWLTAEYGMLPASTGSRKPRPAIKPDGRAVEIQRLIGRAMRSVVAADKLGENTIYLDCDVLEADGGTRTAAITGSYVALALAIAHLAKRGCCRSDALCGKIAAVSVGIVNQAVLLDLNYAEDSAADVDMNVVMTGDGKFVEVQASSERAVFDAAQLQAMLALAAGGIGKLLPMQSSAIKQGVRA
jgi:ribonuclease PH